MQQTQADWRDPSGKLERIHEKWGDTVPDYLFYCIDPLQSVKTAEVVGQCFPGSTPNFGDIEVHRSVSRKPGAPRMLLRVRNATCMPLELTLSADDENVRCPLTQVGYGATTLFNNPDPRCISFVE